ncbi:MAG: sulfite exporter TauE/SafE family protein, partial [Bdellovibrionaceae bacterium]|nr:sulfite exporter TauE/SafE family protein [Pseudobdellovibrionaceae bacterium]
MVGLFAGALSGFAGIGGGVLLLSILSQFLLPQLVLPVHGCVQMVSNLIRIIIGWHVIRWGIVWPFLFGAVVGGIIGYHLFVAVATHYLRLFLGLVILLLTWIPFPRLVNTYTRWSYFVL